jgi:hypothetical protein
VETSVKDNYHKYQAWKNWHHFQIPFTISNRDTCDAELNAQNIDD